MKAAAVDPVLECFEKTASVAPEPPSMGDAEMPEGGGLETIGEFVKEAVEEAAVKIKEKAEEIVVDAATTYRYAKQQTTMLPTPRPTPCRSSLFLRAQGHVQRDGGEARR